jgi:hypothetical protein
LLVARAGGATNARRGYVPRPITQLLDLSALGRGVVIALDFIGLTARQVSALVEQHPLGWILLAVLWVAVWLLNGLGGR